MDPTPSKERAPGTKNKAPQILPGRPKTNVADPKLAKVRTAIADNDWDTAIKLAARVTLFGKHAEAIQRGKDAITKPEFYRQLGRDPDKLRQEAIAALKERIEASDAVAKTS